MLVVGIVLTTLGSVLPALVERFAISKAEAGSLFSLLSFGIMVGSLMFGPIVDRFAYKTLLLASLALIFVGLEGLGGAPSFAWLRPATLVVGLGTGAVNGAANSLVADISEGERGADLSLLGIFFGIGAVGVPLGMSVMLRYFDYGSLILGLGFLVAIPLALIAVTRFPAPKQSQGFPLRAGVRLLRDPVLL